MTGASRPIPTAPTVGILTAVTLVAGHVTKQACFAFGAGNSFYCHSDYGPIYFARQLAGGRFPYHPPALEYPAALGLLIWLASSLSSTAAAFVVVNILYAAGAAVVTIAILWRLVRHRALFFAAAPTLALYAFLNWDLVAIACAVGAVAAFLSRRDALAGLLLGLGTALKIFPALLLVPFLAERVRERHPAAVVHITLTAAIAVAALNFPIAWIDLDGWAHFFRFSSARGVDWGSLWSVACQTSRSSFCDQIPLVNAISLASFLALAILVWVLVTRVAPHVPRWQLAFPLIVAFLITNKVYSPQYSLWLLPWFALVLPDVRLFVMYEVVDVGVYVTTFAWQQRLADSGGLPVWPLDVFIVLRAAVLITMVAAFARRVAGSPEAAAAGSRPR